MSNMTPEEFQQYVIGKFDSLFEKVADLEGDFDKINEKLDKELDARNKLGNRMTAVESKLDYHSRILLGVAGVLGAALASILSVIGINMMQK